MKTEKEIRKEIIKDFVTFLKENHAYTQYRNNLVKDLQKRSYKKCYFVHYFHNGMYFKIFYPRKMDKTNFDIALASEFLNYTKNGKN